MVLDLQRFSFWGWLAVLAAPMAYGLSLDEAVRAAMTKSESVRQGEEQLSQAEEKIAQLKGGIFPNLSFNLSHVMQDAPSDPVAASFSPSHQTTANLSVTQPIFKGLKEWEALGQAQHLRSALQAGQEQLVARAYQETSAAYFQVLSLEQDRANLKEQSGLYEKRIGELGSRQKRGESNSSDVVTAQATHASLLAELDLLEGQVAAARETFHFLTGLPLEAPLVDPKLATDKELKAVDEYLKRIEFRPDVKAAKERWEASDQGIGMARAGHFPSIEAVGNYYFKRPGFLSDIKWDVGLRLTFPIFEGFGTQARIGEAVSRRKEAEIELERTRRAAQQEIRTLHRRLDSRLRQLKNLKRSTELSQTNSTLLQRDYRRGLAKNIDVQLALTEHRIAQRSFDQAYFASQLDLVQLRVASAESLLPEKEAKK